MSKEEFQNRLDGRADSWTKPRTDNWDEYNEKRKNWEKAAPVPHSPKMTEESKLAAKREREMSRPSSTPRK